MPPTHGIERIIYYVGFVLYAKPFSFLFGMTAVAFFLASFQAWKHKNKAQYGYWQQWFFWAFTIAAFAFRDGLPSHSVAVIAVNIGWAVSLVIYSTFLVRQKRADRVPNRL